MLFEIKNATLKEVRDTVSGTSKSGNAWTKATAVIDKADGSYTDSYPMLVFGDKIQDAEALVGREVDVKFSVQGREYNGRWYTDLRLQFISASAPEAPAQQPAPEPAKEDDPDGDLPF